MSVPPPPAAPSTAPEATAEQPGVLPEAAGATPAAAAPGAAAPAAAAAATPQPNTPVQSPPVNRGNRGNADVCGEKIRWSSKNFQPLMSRFPSGAVDFLPCLADFLATLPGGIFTLPGRNVSLCGGIFALPGGMFACLVEFCLVW